MSEAVKSVDENIVQIFGIYYDCYVGLDIPISPIQLKDSGIEFVSYPWKYVKSRRDEFDSFVNSGLTIFSLSPSNIGAKKRMKAGVCVNLVDNYYSGPLFFFRMISFYLLKIKKVIVNVYIYGKRYGVRNCIKKLLDKFF